MYPAAVKGTILRVDSSQSLLVTGGAGFIGANLVDWVLRAGNQVTILTICRDAG